MVCLEELVREAVIHARKILLQCLERSVVGLAEQQIEFGSVHLKPVHLLVIEVDGANYRLGTVELLGRRAQTVIRNEVLVLGEPRAYGARQI